MTERREKKIKCMIRLLKLHYVDKYNLYAMIIKIILLKDNIR